MPQYVFGVYIPDGGAEPEALQILTTSVPSASQGVFYTVQLQATGGTTPYTWSLVSPDDSLPPGLSFTSGGLLSGIPTSAGTFPLNFRVTDDALETVTTGLVNVQVAQAGTFTVTTSSMPFANRGVNYIF